MKAKSAAFITTDQQSQQGIPEQNELRHRGTVKIQRNVDTSRSESHDSHVPAKPGKTDTDLSYTLKQVEGLKIASLVLLAIICRLVLKCGFGLFYFQVLEYLFVCYDSYLQFFNVLLEHSFVILLF